MPFEKTDDGRVDVFQKASAHLLEKKNLQIKKKQLKLPPFARAILAARTAFTNAQIRLKFLSTTAE